MAILVDFCMDSFLRTSKLSVSLMNHILLRYLILLLLPADVEVSSFKDSITSIKKFRSKEFICPLFVLYMTHLVLWYPSF